MGTVFAVSRLRLPRLRSVAVGYVLASSILACYFWGLAPFSRDSVYPHSAPDSPAVRSVTQARRSVTPNPGVSAAYAFGSHLDHRRYCYQWPTPFRATYWGLYTQEGQTLPSASTVQYLVTPSYRSGVDAA